MAILAVCAGLAGPVLAQDKRLAPAPAQPPALDIGRDDAPEPPANDGLAGARRAVQGAPGVEALFAACPADIWRSRVTLRALIATPVASEEACAADRAGCIDACLVTGDGASCVYLGLALETSGRETDAVIGRRYHALGCAQGDPSGCTNRGGGIRNVPVPEDPMSTAPEAERFTCLFPTFTASCAAGDAWGCTMAGQAHANGEGTAPDVRMARRRFDRACVLAGDPDFGACSYARALAAALDPEAGPGLD